MAVILNDSHRPLPKASALISSGLQLIVFLLPTFVTGPLSRIQRKPQPTAESTRPCSTPKPIHPTAYLDGLRGVAAFTVYVFHFSYLWYPMLRSGYGAPGADNMFWQMTIIRVLHSGRASLNVFFIISGYVLSIKTIRTVYQGKKDSVLGTLSGMAFRRPFRLYLPILAATAIMAVMRHLGAYTPDPTGGGPPPLLPTVMEQFQSWFWSMMDIMNPFRLIPQFRVNMHGNDYDGHLWTIPVEFKGSLTIFVLLLMLCLAKKWVRMLFVAGVFYCQIAVGDLDQSCFTVGLFLAELSVCLPPIEPASSTKMDGEMATLAQFRRKRTLRAIGHIITIPVFILALHFLSYPEVNGATTPGFRLMTAVTPSQYRGNDMNVQNFWLAIGSFLMITSLIYSPPVAEVCTSSRRQFLGRISYSLYLWHATVNHTVGTYYLNPAWATLHAKLDESKSDYDRAWILGFLVNTLMLLWVSDVFDRAIDTKALAFTRRLGQWAWSK
ncbi:hypothetical protein GQ53DRAFT_875226 [Thozetella sp. PMI_491]|nr:hypothetical protein GQ53DRAFT_875226 [Thozetella sp. PMI_491]